MRSIRIASRVSSDASNENGWFYHGGPLGYKPPVQIAVPCAQQLCCRDSRLDAWER